MAAWEERYKTMLYAVSHDLGAPLRHQSGFARLLLEERDGLDPESVHWLELVHSSAEIGQSMLNGLLRLSRVYTDSPQLAVERVSVLTRDWQAGYSGRVDDELMVRCDPLWLHAALQEVTINARDYGGGWRLSLAADDAAVTFQVFDSGGGIPADRWEEALKPLKRLRERPTVDHPGVGLSVAEAIMQRLGGELLWAPDGCALRLPRVADETGRAFPPENR